VTRIGPRLANPEQVAEPCLYYWVIDLGDPLAPCGDVVFIDVLDRRREAPAFTREHRSERATGAFARLTRALVECVGECEDERTQPKILALWVARLELRSDRLP